MIYNITQGEGGLLTKVACALRSKYLATNSLRFFVFEIVFAVS
jgi:hypothetical protein